MRDASKCVPFQFLGTKDESTEDSRRHRLEHSANVHAPMSRFLVSLTQALLSLVLRATLPGFSLPQSLAAMAS